MNKSSTKLIHKIFYAMLTIFIAVSSLFVGIRMTPGDPVTRILGDGATLEETQKLRIDLGLHLSRFAQYQNFVTNLIKGDLGKSLYKKDDVINLIKKHLAPTIILATFSLLLAILWGIPCGFLCGKFSGGIFDNLGRIILLIILAFPIFSLAPLMVLIFSIYLGWFPVSEWGSWRNVIIPMVTLALPLGAILSRVMRNKYLEEINGEWIKVLKAKGLSTFSCDIRLLKVCLPTILNVVAIQLSVVLAGTMVTETIFDIPGLGLLLLEAIQNRDYPIVQGIIIYSTIIYMLVYFFIDFLNEKLDPRMAT